MTKKIIFILTILSLVFLLRAWDDEQLFTSASSSQRPFIMILMDTSSSMNETVFYPKDGINNASPDSGYDPYKSGGYSGTLTNAKTNFADPDPTTSESSILDSRYYGFRVNTLTNTIYAADYKTYSYQHGGREYTAICTVISDDGTIIKVDEGTYGLASTDHWVVGKTSGAHGKVTAKSSSGSNYYLTLASRSATFPATATTFTAGEPIYLIQALGANEVLKCAYYYGYGSLAFEMTGLVRYSDDYLKWLLLHATPEQLKSVSYFHKYGTFDTSVISPNLPVEKDSNCNCSSVNEKLIAITRIQAGQEAMCSVIVANYEKIVVGLARFWPDDPGGRIVEPLNNVGSKESLLSKVYGEYGASGNTTPLAMALADVWHYFKPNTGQQGDYWPTGWKNDGTFDETLAPSVGTSGFVSGGANPCTHFYNILVSDGESDKDKFSIIRTHLSFANSIFEKYNAKRKQSGDVGYVTPPASWKAEYGFYYLNGWGDYDSHDTDTFYNDNTRTYCPDSTCWLNPTSSDGGSDLLDDVSYLMYHSDMIPNYIYLNNKREPEWPGDQNVVTHVVGFNVVNDLLKETAKNGEGKFFTSSNYEDLSLALQTAINTILLREDNMLMYNVFAAPKQAVTANTDLFGFKGTFWPRNNKTFWEGHLMCYILKTDPKGDFPDDANYEWDSYDKLKATASPARNIYTFTGIASLTDANAFTTGTASLTDASNAFTTSIDPTKLGLLATQTGVRDQVVNFIRGDNGFDYKLGDIFHFNPIVVGSPLQWKGDFDPSYLEFANTEAIKNRKEVVYVGANDGMIHAIEISPPGGNITLGGNELWGFIPPSHLRRVQKLATVPAPVLLSETPKTWEAARLLDGYPLFPCPWDYDRYFVDGKCIVKDVKYGTTPAWHTVMIFGMGIGGRSYCALDVSDSANPKFLWEFTDPDLYMGYSEARPLIVEIRESPTSASYPAVIIPGGYDFWELPAEATDSKTWTGKSLYILKVEPGENFKPQVVKKFMYVRNGTEKDEVVAGVQTLTTAAFIYPFTAAPSAFDRNNDGYADYIYACDTGDYHDDQPGGSIWKINVSGAPSTWKPTKIFQAQDRQTLFLSPTLGYDLDGNLWVFAGSGRRSQITAHTTVTDNSTPPIVTYNFNVNPNGQFYAFQDQAYKITVPYSYPLLASDSSKFRDITPLFKGTSTDQSLATGQIGIFFDYYKSSPEGIFEPNPIFIESIVSMNTFAPEVTSTTDPCGATEQRVGGSHYVYQFTLGRVGAAGIGITNTNVMDKKILGYGLLSSGQFVIYFGLGQIGTFSVTGRQDPSLDDVFGPVVWKENKK